MVASGMNRQQTIEEITRRLIEHFRPERIYLFGSAARGETGPDSDLDFLVVLPDEAPADLLHPAGAYVALRGVGCAVDVIPWRRGDFDGRAAHVKASMPATVVREGKLLYDAATVSH